MYGHTRTYRAYLAFLAGLCFAVFSVSSLAQELPPGQRVSLDWSPTTSHWQTNNSTFRTPPGTFTSSSTSVGPVVRTAAGGAAQPLASGITITSIERTAPISSVFRAAPAALRAAVTRCFGNPLCVAGVTVGTIGIQELLDRTDWSIFDDELVSEFPVPDESDGSIQYSVTQVTPRVWRSTISEACEAVNGSSPLRYRFTGSYTINFSGNGHCTFETEYGGTWEGNVSRRGTCPPTSVFNPSTGICASDIEVIPVLPSEISDNVDQYYDFHPSDWPVIGPYISLERVDVEIEITDLPSLITPPKTTTVYNDEGEAIAISETNIDYSFSPRPGTNPGPKPSIDMSETETTTTSNPDGTVTGSTTTTTTAPAGDVAPGTGAGGGAPQTPWPGFCEWASVVCGWLDWTQEGWPEEEPELPQLIDFVPDTDGYQVGGPGACPAPYTFNIGWKINQSMEVSYQPFCDFGALVKPLFLAFCYLFAGVITVRSL